MKSRLLASALLAATVLGLIAALDAALDEPQEQRLPIMLSEASPLASAELLHEFAGFAYADLAEGDWNGLALSLLPGSETTCDVESLAIHAGGALRGVGEKIEAAIARHAPARVQMVRLPAVEWRVAGMNVEDERATVERRAHALGRDTVPPLTRVDRWLVANGAWWLEPESVAPGCGSEVRVEDEARDRLRSRQAVAHSNVRSPSGRAVGAVSPEGRALTVTLVETERGVSPAPPQHGI